MAFHVAMIGLAHPHSEGYLETLDELKEIESVALFDPNQSIVDDVARKYPKASGAHTELQTLLTADGITHALIAMPTDQVVGIMVEAIKAGSNVFAEKPGARSAKEFANIFEALVRYPVTFGIGYTRRKHPGVQQMRNLYQDQAIGQLRSVELRMVTTQVGMRDPGHWLFKREIAGGGIISWLGCHLLDLVRYVTDEEFTSVTAQLETTSGESINVEDTAAVTFRMSGGAVGSLHAGYLLPSGRPGYQGATFDQGIHLRGSHGNMSYSFDNPLVLESISPTWRTASPRTFEFTLPPSRGYGGLSGLEFFREFLLADSNRSVPAGPTDALRVLEVLDAVYESADTGRNTVVVHREIPTP